MYTNPLRVLDSKNPEVQALQRRPALGDYLTRNLVSTLPVCANCLRARDRLHRKPASGARSDYYNRTVFEWVTNSLGSRGTVCAGGRYDGLVEQLVVVQHRQSVLRWASNVLYC